MDRFDNKTFTLTFCEAAENHIGMQKTGIKSLKGFDYQVLINIKNISEENGYQSELIALHENINDSDIEEAWILVIRNGTKLFIGNLADSIFDEQNNLDHDKKFYNKRSRREDKVDNKIARHNLCFSDFSQEPDYPAGKGRIVNYDHVPATKQLKTMLSIFFNEEPLQCEGNYYYDIRKTGIGYHYDLERKKVIAVRMGCSLPLYFQWFKHFKSVERKNIKEAIGEPIIIQLNDGDIYVMSEKAVGSSLTKNIKYTIKHATGCSKYTTYKPPKAVKKKDNDEEI
jgi:hypothetical protein